MLKRLNIKAAYKPLGRLLTAAINTGFIGSVDWARSLPKNIAAIELGLSAFGFIKAELVELGKR